jgi:peptidoglycan/LPS O-acetylase OafA/YrhL
MPTQASASEDPHVPRTWIKPYYRSFNGIRGLAVLMVFLTHYADFWHSFKLASCTWVGVDLFFVLSGFLITGILYDSLKHDHFFRNFYIRRALRIFPIFYGFFLLLLVATPLLHLHYDIRVVAFPLYVGNLIVPFTDLGRHNPTMISILHHGRMFDFLNIGHLWSLCVEEQFYLIWPAVVWVVRDRRKLMKICIVLSVAVLLGRCYIRLDTNVAQTHPYLIFWSTYTRCDTLLIGSWLALWLRQRKLSPVQLRKLAHGFFWPPLLVLAVGVMFQQPQTDIVKFIEGRFIGTIGFTLIALTATGIILFSLDEESPLSKILQSRPLATLGTVSYGFYFLHDFPMSLMYAIAGKHPKVGFILPFFAFGITLLLATLSFHFYEAPFLKLKSKLAPGHKSIPSGREDISLA